MTSSFRGKSSKDIETATETVISAASFLNPYIRGKSGSNLKTTSQTPGEDSFDSSMEKRVD